MTKGKLIDIFITTFGLMPEEVEARNTFTKTT